MKWIMHLQALTQEAVAPITGVDGRKGDGREKKAAVNVKEGERALKSQQ